MSNDFDKQVSVWTESVIRSTQRRKFFSKGIKGVAAIISGATLGSLASTKGAFAAANVTCTCDWAQGRQCASTSGCPSGCSVCTKTDWCSGWCDYPGGSWVSCSGLGHCGYGYRTCLDCKCSGCNNLCTVLSDVICSGCCSPQDIEAEMKHLIAANAAAV